MFVSFYFQICPVCARRVGTDLVNHITTQHRSLLKISLHQLAQVMLCIGLCYILVSDLFHYMFNKPGNGWFSIVISMLCCLTL